MVFDLDLDTLRAAPVAAAAPAMVQCDLTWLDGSGPVRAVAAADPAGARSTRRPSSGCAAFAGTELEFIVFDDTYEEAWDRGYRDLTPATSTTSTTRMLGHHPGRAAAARDPQRDVRRRADRRVAPRASATSASTRSPSGTTRSSRTARQPRRLQERRQGDRRPARQGADLHGQVRRARGQLLPHPPLAARHRRRDWCSPTTSRRRPTAQLFDQLRRRHPGHDARVHPALRAEHQLLQAVPAAARSRRPRSPGAATTAPARCGWSATAPALRVENRVPGGDVNPYLAVAAHARRRPARHRERARRSSRPSPATPTTSDKPHVPATLREARDLFAGVGGGPRRRSATRWSTTTSTRPTSSWPPSTRRSPTGSASAGSSGCEHRSTHDGPRPRGRQPGDRGRSSATVRRSARRRGRPTRRSRARRGGVRRLAARSPRPTGPAAAPVRRRRRRAPSRSWRSSRCATPGTRSATPAGRPATSATC